MLEKDIENLIAQHPEEFFPNRDLTLTGQQIRLESYFADIIFEKNDGNLMVIEVKRGILGRDAVGQIIDYYGVLKGQYPEKSIVLVIAANVIPKERKVFLAEKLGIEFIEIPQSKINQIARKYNYTFLDEQKPEEKEEFREVASKFINEVVQNKGSNAWIFQANPQRYDILNALSDPELDKGYWLVNRYKDRIQEGDKCVIWMSGKDAGIYAVADIISDPGMMEDDKRFSKYWHVEEDRGKTRLRVRLDYNIKLINNPLLREEIKNQPELKNLMIFRQPQGTNFLLTQDEWKRILEILKDHLD